MTIRLYNTLTRKKEEFAPLDPLNVRMYVCGPTVYDRPHLGNARSVVVYDVLYRLLKHVYGEHNVTYVRNITDVDDKINAAAKDRKITIQALTSEVTASFHNDMHSLNVLPPTLDLSGTETPASVAGRMVEPRATRHIPHMIAIIERLIASKHAYVSQGHVLFSVESYKEYGALSGRKIEDLIAGARVGVESYKRNPGDFVLWKPADKDDDASSIFDSPWGKGRPGWHIECSAMSQAYLGDTFDIHGGGADLMFPHHENEIAQSRCATPGANFARMWVHNGFLTVNGEKMAKSAGNFTTVHDLLSKGIQGETIRYALLTTRYSEPLDWNEKILETAKNSLDNLYRCLKDQRVDIFPTLQFQNLEQAPEIVAMGYYRIPRDDMAFQALEDDLNTPLLLSELHTLAKQLRAAKDPIDSLKLWLKLKAVAGTVGLLEMDPDSWFKQGRAAKMETGVILQFIDERNAAKKARDYAKADSIRKKLSDDGIILEDRPDGTTDWRWA